MSTIASALGSAASNAVSQLGTTAQNAISTLTGTSSTTPSSSSNSSSSSSSSSSSTTTGAPTIAGNFNTFLQLLTTQLQNQDPLDPLDTDQFTQQLVEFASVEQQVNMNTNLQTLISMQQTTEATSALQLVGSTVTIAGNAATLSNATSTPASWSLNAAGPATANITITSSAGTTVYTGTMALNAGLNTYTWSGQGSNGQTWPDGTYTLSVNATGANGTPVTVSTQVQGVVSGVNINQNPPTLTVSGQNVPMSQIQSISNNTLGSTLGNLSSSLNSSISGLGTSLNSSLGNLNSSISSLIQKL
jgi:flagellar basal-body rod modification protein FlgD